MAAITTPGVLTHHDCAGIATALDGLAHGLHEGHGASPHDLEDLEERADGAWMAGPLPAPRRQAAFEAARGDFEAARDLCAVGAAYETGVVEHAAHRMAHQLRHMAEECHDHDVRGVLPSAVSVDIERLATKFTAHQ
ncbi:MAG: hypothetical protein QOD77_235 [Thermoplasmata archaeon]|jgi:hypothetical protein|nr:hypothetical protein [Thermoplasmata archaeon]